MSLAKRVLLIGWSGVDWPMIHPLLDTGQLPYLERLVDQGSIGQIASLQPGAAPLVWSSIATGARPSRHGVVGNLRREGDKVIPTTPSCRSVAAFWEICSAAGLKTHVINWPTYPAESTRGVFISHLFTRFGDGTSPAPHALRRAITGTDDSLNDLRIDPRELGPAELLPFVPRAASIDQERDPGLAILASRVADAVSAHAMATAVVEGDWDVAAVCYDLFDRLGHSFMRFHPPRRDVTHHSFVMYQEVMSQALRFYDQMLGRLLQLAGEDTHVVLFSDRGIRSGEDRPRRQSSGRGDTSWHTPLGLLAIRGRCIHADRWVWGGNVMDLAPTLYRLVGIRAEGLDGRAIKDAFEPAAEGASEECVVPTEPRIPPSSLDAQEVTSLERWLLDDGYVREDDLRSKQAAELADEICDWNLAQSHLQFGETAAALELFQVCHYRRPEVPRFVIAASRCQVSLGELDAARVSVERAVKLGTPTWLGDRLNGQLLAAEDRFDESLERLLMSEAAQPQQRGINTEIGAVYTRLGCSDEARRAFNKELLIDANEASALQGLGKLAMEDADYEQALEYLLSSVALREVSPETHYLLAKTLWSLECSGEALQAVERALRQAPGFPQAVELRRTLMLARHK